MTKLLVSVRDAAEAEDAVAAGAHLIDVKEPEAGSLGAAPFHVIDAVVRTVAGRRPVSAAFGELIDYEARLCGSGERSRALAPRVGPWSATERPSVRASGGVGRPAPNDSILAIERLKFAKLGLAGCVNRSDWQTGWQRAAESLPKSAALVAVVYADWQQAEAPPPEEVIRVGGRAGCRAMLIDTFHKQGPGLLGVWSSEHIGDTIAAARDADMLTVVGGQLTVRDLPLLLPLAPDYIAVRGAVCSGSRTARLDPDRVRQLVRAL